MNKNSTFKKLLIVSLSILIGGCQSKQIKTIPPLKKKVNEEVIVDKRGFTVNKEIPHLAALSMNSLMDEFPIKVVENPNLPSAAQAARVYVKYDKTDKCTISINSKYEKITPIPEISPNLIKLFVYLHEIAHCADNERVPNGIDKEQWLESLAEGYATGLMLQNNLLSVKQVELLTKYRNSTKNYGAVKINKYFIQERKKHKKLRYLSEREMLQIMKLIRKEIFKVK